MLHESVINFGATSKLLKLWVNHIGRFLVRFHRQNASCHCKRVQIQGWAQTSDFKTYQTDFLVFCRKVVVLQESVVNFGATAKLLKLWVNHFGRFLVRFNRQNACCHCKRGQIQGWAQTSDFKTYQTDIVTFCSQDVFLQEYVVSFGATSKQ